MGRQLDRDGTNRGQSAHTQRNNIHGGFRGAAVCVLNDLQYQEELPGPLGMGVD